MEIKTKFLPYLDWDRLKEKYGDKYLIETWEKDEESFVRFKVQNLMFTISYYPLNKIVTLRIEKLGDEEPYHLDIRIAMDIDEAYILYRILKEIFEE